LFEGIKNLSNLGAMLKQAQQMGSKLQSINEQLKLRRTTGSAGGGMVTVEVNGLGEILRCSIDPSLFQQQDREMVEELLPAAINQAVAKSRQLHAEAVQGMAGDLELPGLQDVLSQISGGPGDAPKSST
jgi:DNA-binding YbaB/EbfC family protein